MRIAINPKPVVQTVKREVVENVEVRGATLELQSIIIHLTPTIRAVVRWRWLDEDDVEVRCGMRVLDETEMDALLARVGMQKDGLLLAIANAAKADAEA
ncbi:hypothetical protein [Thermosphaera sp.]